MFNKDFYPTPTPVIEQMLMGVDIQNKTILEPSAGKGNIVDYLNANGAKEVMTCELSDDLAKIVSSKSRFLKSDFMDVTREEVSHLDLIIMNPPFSRDDKHIMHAWDIAPACCTIISLCNSNTLDIRFSSDRKILNEIIELNGRYEKFGSCFDNAERQTNVNVSCVWLYKPNTGKDEFEDFFSLDEDLDDGIEGVAQYNYVRDIVGRYVQAVQMFDEVINASDKINEVIKPIYKGSYNAISFGATASRDRNSSTKITREVFKKELQKSCWQRVFGDLKMDKYMTRGVRENINEFVEKQQHVPFTMKNVYRMAEMIVGTHASRMGQVLIEAFDLICSYSADNSGAGEKWKTNSDYMINKKFIVPWICKYDNRWPSAHVELDYGKHVNDIEDIIKALCHLTGTNYDELQNIRQFVSNTTKIKLDSDMDYRSNRERGYIPMEWGQWYNWEPFFKVRGYKKGTMHFEFLNEDVWMKFNIEVARAKGWQLPKARKANSRRKSSSQSVSL